MKTSPRQFSIFVLCAAMIAGVGLSVPTAQAAVKTWTGTTDANWATATNWGSTAPVTADSLVFTTATGAGGLTLSDNLMTPATISIAGITFNSGSGAYIINPAAGTNGFTLAGNVLNNSTSLQTINDLIAMTAVRTFTMTAGGGNITLGGVVSGTSGGITTAGVGTLTLSALNTYTGATTVVAGTTLSETSTGGISGAGALTINSAQAFGGTAGSATLLGNNTYTGTTTVGSISNNTASPYNVASLVAPTLTLSGANNGQGTITVNPGATLKLDFGAATAPATNILNTSTNATGVSLSAATLNIAGKASTTNSQQINGLSFYAGTSNAVSLNSGASGTLNVTLGALARSAGSIVDFTLPGTGTVTSTTTSSIGTNKVLVNATGTGAAYATAAGGTTWATNTTGTIGSLATYNNNAFTAGLDTNLTASQNPGSAFTINTLRFNTDGVTLTNTGASVVSSGGILITPSAVTTGVTITGGTSIASGSGNEMVIINNGKLFFNTPIVNAAGAITVGSSPGFSGVSTFGGNNTFNALTVTSGSTTFSGNNTFSGLISVGYGATLTLSGNNVGSPNFGWSTQGNSGIGGGTLVLAAANALGTGALQNSQNGTANIVKFASDTQVSGGGASTATINFSNGNGAATNNWVMDRATAGTAAVNEIFGSAFIGQAQTLNLLQGSNYTTGFALPTITVSGATTFGATNNVSSQTINASGAIVSLGALNPVAQGSGGPKIATLVLNGTSTGNLVTGTIADIGATTTQSIAAIAKSGTGTWTFSGANTYTGATTLNGGTLALDYTTNNNSKIAAGAALTLSGGTLQLNGGSTAQAVLSTTLNTGQSQITQNTGTSTVALGAITFTNGALDFGTTGIATTTTANAASGILSARATVAGTDWAANNGSNSVVAYTGYTAGLPATASTSTVNYSLLGSQTVTATETVNTLKIATSGAGQSLILNNAATFTLANNGLLFTGSNAYAITTTGAGKVQATGNISLQDWGTGVLTLGAIGSNLDKFGTGKTVLASPSQGGTTVSVFAGTLQYSADAQLSNSTQGVVINGSYGKGAALVADVSGGSITTARTIALGAQGGNYIDVVGNAANTLTLSGVISGTQSAVANNIVTFGGASAVDATNNVATSGIIALTAANTYSGGTSFAGGTVNLGVAENAGFNGPLGIGGTLTFTGGTLQYSASNQFDYSSRFSPIANQSFNIDTNGQAVTFASSLAGASSALTKTGLGTLTLKGFNTYTGATTISGGQLIIDDGSIAASSNIVNNAALVYNLNANARTYANVISGTGSLTKSGTNTLTLTGVNTYTGTTTISGGQLTINDGSIATSSNIVNNAALVYNLNVNPRTYANVISGTGSLTKSGTNTLTLTGTNTFTGATTITAGTLLLGASNVLADSSNVVLNGGILSEGVGFSETVGTLSLLLSSSTIDLGSTTSSLAFADSSAASWGSGLSITGSFMSGSSLRFGTTNTGLTSGQLALINITGNSSPISLDGMGYLITSAIPEPSTYAALAGALALVGAIAYRRRRS